MAAASDTRLLTAVAVNDRVQLLNELSREAERTSARGQAAADMAGLRRSVNQANQQLREISEQLQLAMDRSASARRAEMMLEVLSGVMDLGSQIATVRDAIGRDMPPDASFGNRDALVTYVREYKVRAQGQEATYREQHTVRIHQIDQSAGQMREFVRARGAPEIFLQQLN